MEILLTASTVAIAILFVTATIVDFATGLVTLWKNAGVKPQPPIETKPAIEQPIEADPWMLPVEETAVALPAEQPSVRQQMLLPAARLQIATLDWVECNLLRAEVYVAELPDAIAMAKSRLPKVAPVVQLELATRQQLIDLGIRRCKKLASGLKVRRYNTMRLAELADALAGKISLTDLAA